MTMKRSRVSDICRVLLLAASVSTLSVASAWPQDLNELNSRILEDPQNVDLNLAYARAAEEQGKLRLALAAYERVLINHPENEEARRGYERMRRTIEPAYSFIRTELGARWDSNPENLSTGENEAYTYFGRATLVDERRIGPKRWRTIANLEGEVTPDVPRLDYAYTGVQFGPVLAIGPHLAAIPSLGVGVSTLDDDYFFSDYNASLTLEGRKDGLSYWGRLRAGWRDYGDESTAQEGAYAELIGGVTVPALISDKDSLVIIPAVRWSGIEGSVFNFLSEEIAPGQYTEFGVDANYYYRLTDNLVLTAGATLRDRYYDRTQIAGEDRHDTYVSPRAGVSVQNVLPCDCSINVMYSYRDNRSNDPLSDYNGQQVSVSLFAQF